MIKNAVLLLRESAKEWMDDGAANIAAALAYYAIFSLSPLLIIIALVLGLVMDRNTVETSLITNIEMTVGEQAAQLLISVLDQDIQTSDIIGSLIWFGIVIWGASGMFAQLQTALNKIWEVKPQPGRSPLILLKNRLLSFGVVILAAIAMLGTMVINTTLTTIIQNRQAEYAAQTAMLTTFRPMASETGEAPNEPPNPIITAAIRVGQILISVTMISVLIAVIYHMLPDVDIHWRDVIVGAVFTAVLLFIGQFLVGLYLSRANVGSVFGAAGSLTVILVWIYYSAQILLFGAEFTEVWARHHGFHIVPDDDATWENEYKARLEVSKAGQDWSEVETAMKN